MLPNNSFMKHSIFSEQLKCQIFVITHHNSITNYIGEHLKWASEKLGDFGVTKIIGAHCTGINSLYTLRSLMNLSRSDAVVGSVGDSFDLENGINAGPIAR